MRTKLLKNKFYKNLEVIFLTFILKLYGWDFSYNWKILKYFYNKYNITYSNERMVEIPILNHYYNKFKWKEILEIWNVMKNYFSYDHDVLDKFDKHNYVTIKDDICSYIPENKYDFVFSISTLEHVWFEDFEKETDNKMIHKAFDNIVNNIVWWTFVFTIPLWYNIYLDSLIYNWDLKTKYWFKFIFIKRNSLLKWIEISDIKKEKHNINYWLPYGWWNYLAIWIYKKQ